MSATIDPLKINDKLLYEFDNGVLKISMPPELIEKLNERFEEQLNSEEGATFSFPIPLCFQMIELEGIKKFESIGSPYGDYFYTEDK